MKSKLLYFGDPMCSWWWGISEHLKETISDFATNLELELVMGGLRPGGGQTWDANMKDFLRNHWQHVQDASGQNFNYDLLNWDDFNYDTEPACRAVVSLRQLSLSKVFDFYQNIQHGFYVENRDPNQLDFYQPICEKLDIDFKKFSDIFKSEESKKLTYEDFHRTQSFGVSGFPTVVLQVKDQFHAVARGYATYDQMKQLISALITNI